MMVNSVTACKSYQCVVKPTTFLPQVWQPIGGGDKILWPMRTPAWVRICADQSESRFGGASLPATRENCGMNTSLRENKPKETLRDVLFRWRIFPTRKWHRGLCNVMCLGSWQDQCSCDFNLYKNTLILWWYKVVTSKTFWDGKESDIALSLIKYQNRMLWRRRQKLWQFVVALIKYEVGIHNKPKEFLFFLNDLR